jgi:hypothetical protein
MALDAHIKDGEGSGRLAGVTKDNALKVTTVEPIAVEISPEILTRRKLYYSFLEDSGGSTDLNIDGSVTPVDFQEIALSDRVKWITGIRFLFNGLSLELDTNDFRRFGEATAINTPLTNGIEFSVEQGGTVSNLFVTPIGTIGQFMDYADGFTNFINAISAQSDFLSFDFNFVQMVVLPRGSTDRILVKVCDDLTAIEQFKVIVRGYQEVIR